MISHNIVSMQHQKSTLNDSEGSQMTSHTRLQTPTWQKLSLTTKFMCAYLRKQILVLTKKSFMIMGTSRAD